MKTLTLEEMTYVALQLLVLVKEEHKMANCPDQEEWDGAGSCPICDRIESNENKLKKHCRSVGMMVL